MRSTLIIGFLIASVLVFGFCSILQGATLEGLVLDATDDSPLENATVSTSFGVSAQSDEEGFWRIENAQPGDFDITASMQDYLDSTITDLHVDDDSTLEINFILLRAECIVDPDSIFVDMLPDDETEIMMEVFNNGNDPLSYTVEKRLIAEDEIDPWEIRAEIGAEEVVDDNQINGVVVVDELIYISGGNNGEDNNFIYIFNTDDEFLGRFDQFVESPYGMRDLTWDSELIWGGESATLYGFNTDGELVSTIEGQARSYRSLAWDPDRNVFWSADVTSDIYATNLNGEVVDDIEVPGDMRIYGLSYWTDDPDGYNLYVMSRGEDIDLQVVKIDIENGDLMVVVDLDADGGRPAGINITNQFNAFNWVIVGIVQNPDRVVVWQLGSYFGWFQIDPEADRIAAGNSEDLFLMLNSTGLPLALYEGELVFLHNGIGGETIVPVSLNVVDELPERPPSAFSLIEPENGDTLNLESVQTFHWGMAIDPNPDDVVNYQIWFQALEDSIGFEALRNSWQARVDTLLVDFEPDLPVTWWVKSISDPDTVECNSRFIFHFYPTSAGETDPDVPYEFAIQSVHPNPFNSSTTIRYSIPNPTAVITRIFNVKGQEVLKLFDGCQQPGIHTATLNAGDLPSGLYFVRLEAMDWKAMQKVMLIR